MTRPCLLCQHEGGGAERGAGGRRLEGPAVPRKRTLLARSQPRTAGSLLRLPQTHRHAVRRRREQRRCVTFESVCVAHKALTVLLRTGDGRGPATHAPRVGAGAHR